ncbi:MAG TPA: hypothetical protein VGM37_02520 [Armatimonadota bacterium]|jgi:hypothetical protein
MASILKPGEIDGMDALYMDSHGEAAISVFTCGRALDNAGEVSGIPAAAWTRRASDVVGVVVRGVKPHVLETFAEPDRLSAVFRARIGQKGKVQAGDVLREADGTVWLVFEPTEFESGRPRVRAGLELVPVSMVPAALRLP